MVGRWAVVAGGVGDEVAQEFAGGGLDDADVEVVDQQQDGGSGVGPADADVMQAAADAEGDGSGVVDAVAADPVVGVAAAVAESGFGSGGVGGGRCRSVRQGSVWPVVVVGVHERVEQGLQLGDGGRLVGLGA